ncbi:hypothetical protein DFH09DRAFT_549130 [Mycena vulgaris]|nr:hypothetical protein DFH09DRAFT_549130 [Mycena vulgaris]
MSFRGRPFPVKTSCRRCATRMTMTTWVSNVSRIRRRGRTLTCVEASHAAVSLSRLRSPHRTCITAHRPSARRPAPRAPRPLSASPSCSISFARSSLHVICLRAFAHPLSSSAAMPARILVQGTLDMSGFASPTECSTFLSSASPAAAALGQPHVGVPQYPLCIRNHHPFQRRGSCSSQEVCNHAISGKDCTCPFARPCIVHHLTSSIFSNICATFSLSCWRRRHGRTCPRSSPTPFPRPRHSIFRPDFLNPRLLRRARCLGDYPGCAR